MPITETAREADNFIAAGNYAEPAGCEECGESWTLSPRLSGHSGRNFPACLFPHVFPGKTTHKKEEDSSSSPSRKVKQIRTARLHRKAPGHSRSRSRPGMPEA